MPAAAHFTRIIGIRISGHGAMTWKVVVCVVARSLVYPSERWASLAHVHVSPVWFRCFVFTEIIVCVVWLAVWVCVSVFSPANPEIRCMVTKELHLTPSRVCVLLCETLIGMLSVFRRLRLPAKHYRALQSGIWGALSQTAVHVIFSLCLPLFLQRWSDPPMHYANRLKKYLGLVFAAWRSAKLRVRCQ